MLLRAAPQKDACGGLIAGNDGQRVRFPKARKQIARNSLYAGDSGGRADQASPVAAPRVDIARKGETGEAGSRLVVVLPPAVISAQQCANGLRHAAMNRRGDCYN